MKIVRDPEWRGKDVETLRVRCPLCKAAKDVKCSVWVPEHAENYLWVPGHSRTAKVPHNERRAALFRKELRERRKANEAIRVTTSARQSYGRAVQDEYLQTQAWLRTNYALFGLRRLT